MFDFYPLDSVKVERNLSKGWGEKPALLIIDVCKAYWSSGSPLDLSLNSAANDAPDAMRRLLRAARSGKCPVLHSQVDYRNMSEAGLFWRKSKVLDVWLRSDTRGLSAGLDGLEPQEGDTVIVKKYASAFFGTTLASALNVMKVDTLVLCGVSTSGCVRATALDAMQNGFRPMVVGSACGDRTAEIQNANLFDLNSKYADVVSEETAVKQLEHGWPR